MLRAAGERAVLHFCCHAWADLVEPLHNRFETARGDALTAADLGRTRSRPARLAVLSACGTAMQGIDVPDEAIGFPTSLVQAGFAGVVGSQWVLPDRVAWRIVTAFSTHWLVDGLSPAQALRRARIELRDLLPGPLPSGWAVLTFTGA